MILLRQKIFASIRKINYKPKNNFDKIKKKLVTNNKRIVGKTVDAPTSAKMYEKIPSKKVIQGEIDSSFQQVNPANHLNDLEPIDTSVYTDDKGMRDFIKKNRGYRSDELNEYYDTDNYGYSQKIYDNYSKAMGRRRDYRFRGLPDIIEERGLGFKEGDSFIMGRYLGDEGKVFVPSHFAPNSMREGYELVNKIGSSKTPTIFAVTEDLSPMLDKTGRYIELGEAPAPFGDEVVMKKLRGNEAITLDHAVDILSEKMNMPREVAEEAIRENNPKLYKTLKTRTIGKIPESMMESYENGNYDLVKTYPR